MLNRWIGIILFGLMMLANTALFMREGIPRLFAGEPPTTDNLLLRPGEERRQQIGVFDARDRRIGTSWTVADRSAHLLTVRSNTVLDHGTLPNGRELPAIRVDTTLVYDLHQNGRLDDFTMSVRGMDIFSIKLHGEVMPPDQFAFEWQLGDRGGKFLVDSVRVQAIGDVLRPFDRLPNLTVGQTWRVELVNPFGEAFGAFRSKLLSPAEYIKVTGRKNVQWRGEEVKVFVVRSDRLRALVHPNGRVLRQEMELPLFGNLRFVDEPYDRSMHVHLLQTFGL